MAGKKVSVVVPCYNHAAYLTEAVGSVLAQTFSDWECIIVNDGSSDNSEAIALELTKRDSRILYFKKENGGLASARNFGVEKSNGTFILPLDADDKIHERYVELAMDAFDEMDVKVVYCDGEYFGAKQGKIDLPDYSPKAIATMNMIFCSAFFRKSDWQQAGGYNLNMRYGWEDWNLWIDILHNGGNVYKIPQTLFYYRIKDTSMLLTLEGRKKQTMFMQLYLNHPEFFDRFYDEPFDAYQNYRDLKDYSKTIEDAYNLLKGLLSLKPKAYATLAKRLTNSKQVSQV